MTKKGTLFSLIKSLSKTEKRYFTLSNSVGQEKKNYLNVFSFIDAQEELDEHALSEAFKNERFGKQLHVTKNYLIQQLLKSLRNYNSSSSERIKLYGMLIDVEILYKKELYDQCYDIIKRARTIAEDYEKFNELLEILSWERRLLVAQHGSHKATSQINEIINYEKRTIEKIDNINQYINLTYNLFGSSVDNSLADHLRENPLVIDESKALSFAAKTYYYHLQYILNTFGGKPETGLERISALILEFEQRPHMIKESPDSYVTALNNKMGALLHMKKPVKQAVELLYKIREVPKKYNLKNDNYVLKVFLKTYNVELELYRDTKSWERGRQLVEETQSFLKHNLKVISDGYLISFYYQFAYIHFKLEDYKKSLSELNVIINDVQSKERQDIQIFARFLLLIIHYELGNIIVLRYAVDATRRFLKKARKPHGFERKLLKFFSRLSTIPHFEHKRLFSQLRKDLFDDLSESEVASVLDYLDFDDWLLKKYS